MQILGNIDTNVLEFIKNNMHSTIMDKIMVTATNLGSGGLIWILIAAALLVKKKYRNVGIMVGVALLLASLLGEEMLKNIIQRARPCTDISQVNLLISKPLSYSFPSGHTASSFAAAGILAKYLRKYAVGFFALASLIGFSRLYLYVHYPTDVLAGIILGLACSWITVFLFKWIGDFRSSDKELRSQE